MLKKLFKLSIVMTIFLTTAYADNKSSIQNDLNNIKIELEKIKIVQKYENRDIKMQEIESSIKDLETRLNQSDIKKSSIEKDFQKYDGIIKRQDERIGDIGLYLTMLGVLITVIIIFFAFRYESIARNQADKEVKIWIDDKADAEFQPKVDEYLQQLETKGNTLLEQIKEEADILNKDHKDKIMEYDLMLNQKLSSKEKEQLDSDITSLEEKDESKYSFHDWYSKFIQKYYEPNFEEALVYINKALKLTVNDIEVSKALFSKAVTLSFLEKKEEAIKEYDRLINRFSDSENETILEQVVSVLFNKGVTLGELEKSEEAIKEYDKLIDRFSDSKNETILEQVAKALNNKGVRLGQLGKNEEAIKEYDKLIDSFIDSNNEIMMEQLAKALYNKGVELGELGKNEEEIEEYGRLIDRFSESKNEIILEQVVKALNNKAVTLGYLGKEEAIEEYDKLINSFSNSKNEIILQQVSVALGNKIEYLLIKNKDTTSSLELAKKLFSKSKNKMIQFSMLELLHNAKELNQDDFINEWEETYKNTNLSEWSFKELDEWNESIKDETIKQRIKKYLDVFKTKVAPIEDK